MIVRVARRPPLLIVSRDVVDDRDLGTAELSVLLYLLSKPDDWEVRSLDVCKRFGFSERTFSRIMRQLSEMGYARRERPRDEDGKLHGTRYIIYDHRAATGGVSTDPPNHRPAKKPNLGKVAGIGSNKEETSIEEELVSKKEDSHLGKYEEVIESWNAFASLHALPTVRVLTKSRKDHIRRRYDQLWPLIDEIYSKISSSSFLRGDNDRGWRMDFDFLWASPNHYAQILEGKYGTSPRKDSPPVLKHQLRFG